MPSYLSPPSGEMTGRNEIRQLMRVQRAHLEQKFREDAAILACDLGAKSHVFINSRRLAAYFPCNGELDILPLMIRAWHMGKTCYLPVLDTIKSNHLLFAPYHYRDTLSPNIFGIPEPTVARRHWLQAKHLDLILTPLLAFDSNGNRLGMGGGYYDRTLSFLKCRHYWQKPRIYGVAYEFQKVDQLSRKPWDIPLHGIITETRIYKVSP